jgi:cyclohexanecarboxyl-CoA dehydrogenase
LPAQASDTLSRRFVDPQAMCLDCFYPAKGVRNMLLNDDQIALRDVARRFAREKLKPHYQAREAEQGFDRALMKEIGALGLIGVDLPEEYGGLGQSGLTSGIITEEMAYGDFNVSYLQLLGSLMGAIVHRNANPELARYWNGRLVAGDAIIGLGLTEPRGGSDAANLQVKARRDGKDFILSGEKTSISFAEQCDAIILFARTGTPDSGARGISAFLVPTDLPGISRTRFNDLGSKIIGRGSVFFDDVRIPAENMMGAEGKGFTQVMQGFDFSRILIALQCIGAAQASVDETWEYMKERNTMGAPIVQYQGV